MTPLPWREGAGGQVPIAADRSEDRVRIVLTGGAGFIGSHVAAALLAHDPALDLAVIDDLSTGDRERLGTLPVAFYRRDVRETLDDLLADTQVVVHLAASAGVPRSVADPLADAQANITGTVALLESCRRAGVRRVVYASSAAIYGVPDRVPICEEDPTHPLSPYGLSKLTGEQYVLMYGDLFGMDTCALRFFNVYGPGQRPGSSYSGVITIFTERLLRHRPLCIEGDGKQTKDFIHVSDVAVPSVWPPWRRGPTALTTSRPGGRPASSTWPRRCSGSPAGRCRLSSTRRDRVTSAGAWQQCSERPKTWASARRSASRMDYAPCGSRRKRPGGETDQPQPQGEGRSMLRPYGSSHLRRILPSPHGGERPQGVRYDPTRLPLRVALLDSRRSCPYSFFNRRKWLSGRASPCQGEGRGFESRLPLRPPRARASMQFSLFCCPRQAIHYPPTMTTAPRCQPRLPALHAAYARMERMSPNPRQSV